MIKLITGLVASIIVAAGLSVPVAAEAAARPTPCIFWEAGLHCVQRPNHITKLGKVKLEHLRWPTWNQVQGLGHGKVVLPGKQGTYKADVRASAPVRALGFRFFHRLRIVFRNTKTGLDVVQWWVYRVASGKWEQVAANPTV